MAKKNIQWPKEKCNGKVCYSKKMAETVKNRCWEQKSIELRVYQCPSCNFWHLTHQLATTKYKKR